MSDASRVGVRKTVRPVPTTRLVAAWHRWRGRVRYHRHAALRPSLRRGGPWIHLGRGCDLTVHRGGALRRGRDMTVRSHGVFDVHGVLTVGRNTFFNAGAQVSVFHGVSIGDEVRFGERLSLHDANHVFEPIPIVGERRGQYLAEDITIGSRVWVGANCVVLGGASIGDDCVVAAGSVVRGRFPPGTLVAGAPARAVRSLRTSG